MHPQARQINGLPVGVLGLRIFRICTIAFFLRFIQVFDVPVNTHTFTMLVFQSSLSCTFAVCQLNIAYCIIYVALMVLINMKESHFSWSEVFIFDVMKSTLLVCGLKLFGSVVVGCLTSLLVTFSSRFCSSLLTESDFIWHMLSRFISLSLHSIVGIHGLRLW